MSEFYGLQNSHGPNGVGAGALAINAGYVATNYPTDVVAIGSGGTAGNTVYAVCAQAGDLIITSFWITLGKTMSATTSPVFKFWRRPDMAKISTAAGGTGDIAMTKETGTAYLFTVPKASPTPIIGTTFVYEFNDGDNVFAPGEGFLAEIDVLGDADTVAICGHQGYYTAIQYDTFSTTGLAKTTTSSVGTIFKVA